MTTNLWAGSVKAVLAAVLLPAATLFAVTSNAKAALIAGSDSRFSWTTDTATGLDWLRFDGGAAPSTVLRSKDDVAGQLGPAGDYEGWRFATNAQVYQFVLHATGASSVNNGATSIVAGWTGYTGQRGQSNNVNTVHGFTVEGYAGLLDTDSTLYENYTSWIPYVGPLNTSEPYEEMGSWLVRHADQSGLSVPEPATLASIAAALLGVAATRSRKPTTATC